MSLKVGDKVPSFEAVNQDNKIFSFDEVKGKNNVVLYFYPKSFTPACSKEAKEFKYSYHTFEYFDTIIIGVSGDSPKVLAQFREEKGLPFTLLSDENNELHKLFGIQRDVLGLVPGRETLVIDKEGILRLKFDQTKVLGHVEQALDCIRRLQHEE